MSQFKDLITIELINSLGKLRSFNDRDEATRNPEMDWAEATAERIANLFNSEKIFEIICLFRINIIKITSIAKIIIKIKNTSATVI
jgi:hypothetical protein